MRATLKLVLLGEGRVGKTSLSSKYVHDQFDESQPPTSSAAFIEKHVVIDGVPVTIALWDTAGQERFHALGPIYYRNADAALLVFDITDTHSYRRIQDWVKELRQMVGPDVALSILANKQDLASSRAVLDDRARAFASAVGAMYYRTSAKTGAGIEQVLFVHLPLDDVVSMSNLGWELYGQCMSSQSTSMGWPMGWHFQKPPRQHCSIIKSRKLSRELPTWQAAWLGPHIWHGRHPGHGRSNLPAAANKCVHEVYQLYKGECSNCQARVLPDLPMFVLTAGTSQEEEHASFNHGWMDVHVAATCLIFTCYVNSSHESVLARRILEDLCM